MIVCITAENVAREKSASQISTFGNAVASLAVDGRYNTESCTGVDTTHPWWAVDLGTVYDVSRVTVTNSNNANHRNYR